MLQVYILHNSSWRKYIVLLLVLHTIKYVNVCNVGVCIIFVCIYIRDSSKNKTKVHMLKILFTILRSKGSSFIENLKGFY